MIDSHPYIETHPSFSTGEPHLQPIHQRGFRQSYKKARATDKDGIVVSFIGKNYREVAHPSYQAWSYKQFLYDMNEAIYDNDLKGYSYAYLHNYREGNPEPLKDIVYQNIIKESALFFADEYF